MSSKFVVSGLNTTITFSWTAPTTLIQEIVGAASNLLWDRGKGDKGTEEVPLTFADLTNVQKLAIVEFYFHDVIVDLANAFKDEKAVKATLVVEDGTKYEL